MKVIVENKVQESDYINIEELEPNKWYLFENYTESALGYPERGSWIHFITVVCEEITTSPTRYQKTDCKFTSAKEIKCMTIEV